MTPPDPNRGSDKDVQVMRKTKTHSRSLVPTQQRQRPQITKKRTKETAFTLVYITSHPLGNISTESKHKPPLV